MPLTRQFAIEYAVLFGAILPALERLGLPVPLGGTSNHFARAALERAGAWDAFNVTEDADLGIRLARHGLKVGILASVTDEDAPVSFGSWLRQRTRWLKGWMQTYLVHMRQPRRLLAELGLRGFMGFQVLMGGIVLSTLVHPWFYVLALAGQVWELPAMDHEGPWPLALWWVGWTNLAAGYGTAVALGAACAMRHASPRLLPHVILMPVYWLAISLASYRALWQLARDPFLWEKTEHAPRPAATVNVPAPPQ